MKIAHASFSLVLLALLAGACLPAAPGGSTFTSTLPTGAVASPLEPVPTQVLVTGLAPVESVEVQVLDQSPPAILVIARGNLPDGCTSIGDTDWAQDGKTFKVSITTVRPEEMMCTQALVPFEETVMMKPAGALASGRYTVDVNGVIATFEVK